jgi:hypothetical protein
MDNTSGGVGGSSNINYPNQNSSGGVQNNSNGNNNNNNNQQGTPPGPANGYVYNAITNVYDIHDPTNIAARGFVNPNTNMPYPTSQPYIGNLAKALEHDNACNHPNPTSSISNRISAADRAFFREYMQNKYPARNRNSYWNSAPVRQEMKNNP